MKTNRLTLSAVGTAILIAAALFINQERELARCQNQLQHLQAQNSALPGLREELARLRQVEVDHAELASLREEAAAARAELPRLRARAAETQRAEADVARMQSELARQARQGSEATQSITVPMAEMMQAGLERTTRRRLSRMQEQLNLSPAQAQAIEGILLRRAQGIGEAAKGVFSGKMDAEKIAAIRQEQGDTESQVLALLSPEQQTAYAAFQEQERTNSARLSANSELVRMEHALALTEDQQDKVFGVLYEQALLNSKAESTSPQPASPAEAEQSALDRKLKALESILTPAQMQSYREEQQAQVNYMKSIVSRMGLGARAQP